MKQFLILAGLVIVAAAVVIAARKPSERQELIVGDEAPDFTIEKAETEEEGVKLSDYEGEKNVLIAFYPKAFTPGCTKQLCGYRDDFAQLKEHDLEIVAVSMDKQAKADEFREEYNLPYPVIGDPKGEIVNAYGVDRMMGLMAKRSVVLVDRQGTVRHVDYEYDIGKDKDPLYTQIYELGTETPPEDTTWDDEYGDAMDEREAGEEAEADTETGAADEGGDNAAPLEEDETEPAQ